jgi:hypothetical protein
MIIFTQTKTTKCYGVTALRCYGVMANATASQRHSVSHCVNARRQMQLCNCATA